MDGSLSILPVAGVPEVRPGDDLGAQLAYALRSLAQAGDILVVTQKIVSKAEGQVVALETVEPSGLARKWAEAWGKDARQIEVVLRESASLVRMERGIIISRTRHGLVCANAAVGPLQQPGRHGLSLA